MVGATIKAVLYSPDQSIKLCQLNSGQWSGGGLGQAEKCWAVVANTTQAIHRISLLRDRLQVFGVTLHKSQVRTEVGDEGMREGLIFSAQNGENKACKILVAVQAMLNSR